jgi:hypothetical protein
VFSKTFATKDAGEMRTGPNILYALFFFLSLSCTLREDSLPNRTRVSLAPYKQQTEPLYGDVECLNFVSTLETPLGPISVRMRVDFEKNRSYLHIENRVIEFNAMGAPNQICKGDAPSQSYFLSLLERAIPACQIRTAERGFSCSLAYVSSEQNLARVKTIKQHLLRQAKRVPYLLSRRLSLAENLGEILTDDSHGQGGLDAFCGVMEGSMLLEQPLILSSRQWKEALCKREGNPKRRELAKIVLTKSVEEIEFMYELQDRVNLAGHMTVKVHNDMLPASGKVWVKLEATKATMDSVLSVARSMRGTEEFLKPVRSLKPSKKHKRKSKSPMLVPALQRLQTVVPVRACWFPGFSIKETLFLSGREMKLWGSREDAPCAELQNKDETEFVSRYFMETISAETTFELSESNTKQLSLPSGAYRYSVYEYPDKLGTKLEKNLVDQGTVVWNGSHQGLNIAKAK